MKLNLLTWNGIFALGRYVPLLSTAFQKKQHDAVDMAHTRRVYNFKKHNKHAKDFKAAVLELKAGFSCDDVAAVPRSTTEQSRLQEVFGVKIERTKAVEQRKVKHTAPLPADYAESYTIHRDRIAGRRVLLVDDVCTSGATLAHFAQALTAAGYELIPAALAFDHKLPALTIAETLVKPAAMKAETLKEEPTETAEVERMAKLGATLETIAAALGVNERTIRRKFDPIMKKARAFRRVKLLELQLAAAEKGNPAVLIFLGKNELGQKDLPDAPHDAAKPDDKTLTIRRLKPPAEIINMVQPEAVPIPATA